MVCHSSSYRLLHDLTLQCKSPLMKRTHLTKPTAGLSLRINQQRPPARFRGGGHNGVFYRCFVVGKPQKMPLPQHNGSAEDLTQGKILAIGAAGVTI